MEERENRGLSPKGGDQPDELEIIDIADLLEDSEPSDSDETLDLEGPDPADITVIDFDTEEGEDSIDLNEIFSELDQAGSDGEDEDIIDLVDVVDDLEEDDSPTPDDAQKTEKTQPDETDDFSFDDFDLETPPAEGPEADLDLDEDFIAAFELEEILSDSPKSQDGIGSSEDLPPEPDTVGVDLIDSFDLDLSEDLDDMPEEKEEVASGPDLRGKAADLLTAAAVGSQTLDSATTPPLDIRVTEEQIDAAVERVIRKMVADKIDVILVEAIERTVLEEISRLKKIINLESLDK